MGEQMTGLPEFNKRQCNNCGLCANVCTRGGFTISDGTVCTDENADCDNCQECEIVCPTGAITFPFEIVEES
jgi:MinD superfamily P-loop ATPase